MALFDQSHVFESRAHQTYRGSAGAREKLQNPRTSDGLREGFGRDAGDEKVQGIAEFGQINAETAVVSESAVGKSAHRQRGIGEVSALRRVLVRRYLSEKAINDRKDSSGQIDNCVEGFIIPGAIRAQYRVFVVGMRAVAQQEAIKSPLKISRQPFKVG